MPRHQGALFRVRVEGVPAGAELRGTVAGEPLHLAITAGAYEALAAAPIDGDSRLRASVACTVGGRTDTLVASIALTAADYPVERLRVAPRLSAPPDSALAARMRRESAMAPAAPRLAQAPPRRIAATSASDGGRTLSTVSFRISTVPGFAPRGFETWRPSVIETGTVPPVRALL